MKTRINGLKYNTEAAIFVGQYNIFADEIRYSFTETLYYKRTGEFFVYRHGGDRDEEDIDNSYWVIRPQIIPMSFMEGKKWVEQHCSKNKLIKLFGDENDEQPDKCSLLSRKLLNKRELKALPYLNN